MQGQHNIITLALNKSVNIRNKYCIINIAIYNNKILTLAILVNLWLNQSFFFKLVIVGQLLSDQDLRYDISLA